MADWKMDDPFAETVDWKDSDPFAGEETVLKRTGKAREEEFEAAGGTVEDGVGTLGLGGKIPGEGKWDESPLGEFTRTAKKGLVTSAAGIGMMGGIPTATLLGSGAKLLTDAVLPETMPSKEEYIEGLKTQNYESKIASGAIEDPGMLESMKRNLQNTASPSKLAHSVEALTTWPIEVAKTAMDEGIMEAGKEAAVGMVDFIPIVTDVPQMISGDFSLSDTKRNLRGGTVLDAAVGAHIGIKGGQAGFKLAKGTKNLAGKLSRMAETETAKAGRTHEIKTTIGEDLNSPLAKKLEMFAEKIPFSGMIRFRQKQLHSFEKAVDSLINDYVKDPKALNAGESNRAFTSELFEQMKEMIPDINDISAIDPVAVRTAVGALLKDSPDIFNKLQNTKLKNMLENIEKGIERGEGEGVILDQYGKPYPTTEAGKVSFQELWTARKGVGEALSSAKKKLARGEVDRTELAALKKVYHSITEDIVNWTDKAGRPDIAQAFAVANESYAKYVSRHRIVSDAIEKATVGVGEGEYISPKKFQTAIKKILQKNKDLKNFPESEVNKLTSIANLAQVVERAGQFSEHGIPTGNRWIELILIQKALTTPIVPLAWMQWFLSTTKAGKGMINTIRILDPQGKPMADVFGKLQKLYESDAMRDQRGAVGQDISELPKGFPPPKGGGGVPRNQPPVAPEGAADLSVRNVREVTPEAVTKSPLEAAFEERKRRLQANEDVTDINRQITEAMEAESQQALKPVETNASGESSASMEALNRNKQLDARGEKIVYRNIYSNKQRPSTGVRPEDNPGALKMNEELVRIDKQGNVIEKMLPAKTHNVYDVTSVQQMLKDRVAQEGLKKTALKYGVAPAVIGIVAANGDKLFEAWEKLRNSKTLEGRDLSDTIYIAAMAGSFKAGKLKAEGTAKHWISKYEGRVKDWNKLFNHTDPLKSLTNRVGREYSVKSSDRAIRTKNEVKTMKPYLDRWLDLDRQGVRNGNPEIQQAIDAARRNPEAANKQLIEHINENRTGGLKEWRDYLDNINEEYAADPFFKDWVWDEITKDLKDGTDTIPPPLDANVLSEVYQKVQDMPGQVGFKRLYEKLAQESAEKLAREEGNAVETSTGGQWTKTPQTAKDSPDWQKNYDQVRKSSNPKWCTSGTMANSYLPKGDFWVYAENGKAELAIRFKGDQVAEIQGPANNGTIPPQHAPMVAELVESGKLDMDAGQYRKLAYAVEGFEGTSTGIKIGEMDVTKEAISDVVKQEQNGKMVKETWQPLTDRINLRINDKFRNAQRAVTNKRIWFEERKYLKDNGYVWDTGVAGVDVVAVYVTKPGGIFGMSRKGGAGGRHPQTNPVYRPYISRAAKRSLSESIGSVDPVFAEKLLKDLKELQKNSRYNLTEGGGIVDQLNSRVESWLMENNAGLIDKGYFIDFNDMSVVFKQKNPIQENMTINQIDIELARSGKFPEFEDPALGWSELKTNPDTFSWWKAEPLNNITVGFRSKKLAEGSGGYHRTLSDSVEAYNKIPKRKSNVPKTPPPEPKSMSEAPRMTVNEVREKALDYHSKINKVESKADGWTRAKNERTEKKIVDKVKEIEEIRKGAPSNNHSFYVKINGNKQWYVNEQRAREAAKENRTEAFVAPSPEVLSSNQQLMGYPRSLRRQDVLNNVIAEFDNL